MQFIEETFIGRCGGVGFRFDPWVNKTKNYLLAFGESDLAEEAGNGWTTLQEENEFDRFHVDLLFTKTACNSSSVCDESGAFDCMVAQNIPCVWGHRVQPRRSIHDFQELTVMELDYIISLKLIGETLLSAAGRRLRHTNYPMIGVLLYGRANFRMAYRGGCHQTTARQTDTVMLENLITARRG